MTDYRGPWSYRSQQYDDWGTVRNIDGIPIARFRDVTFSQSDLEEHRRNRTDPYEKIGRLGAAASEMFDALKGIAEINADVCDELVNREFGGDCTIGEAVELVLRTLNIPDLLARIEGSSQ